MAKRKSNAQRNTTPHPLRATLQRRWPELTADAASLGSNDLFVETVVESEQLVAIHNAMEEKSWSQDSQISLVRFLLSRTKNDVPTFHVESVVQWIRHHQKDDIEAVTDCIALLPPSEVTVIGRLPRKGSQKIVFLANWKLQQRTVILKKLLIDVLQRELRSHPLSASHPNIIKTYPAQNAKGEIFVIEDYLDDVLDDNWPSPGVEKTALLLHDIASALSYLEKKELIHGDVKPDNIGFHDGRFILLDFGICRLAKEFSADKSATGSLRTRAPELLNGSLSHTIESDVWALAAVIACVFCRQFPLIDPGEVVPRVSDPASRLDFEKTLTKRVLTEYDQRVRAILDRCNDERLKFILENMLNADPKKRPTPATVVEMVKAKLGYAIPASEGDAPWASSPSREIEMLSAQWSDRDSVARIPAPRVRELKKYVEALDQKLKDAPRQYQDMAAHLLTRLKEATPL